MDHDRSGQEARKRCIHGNCDNHDPQWTKEEKYEDSSWKGYFDLDYILARIFAWHCGKPMRVTPTVMKQTCKECGRIKTRRFWAHATCHCCGYHISRST